MNYDEFVGQVQHRARLPSTAEAVRATRSTLEVLAARLYGDEARELAAQLPREIAIYLEAKEEPRRFGLQEFFKLVQEREGVDMPESVYHARAVISVLQDAVTPGEIEDARAQLGAEWDPLFDSGDEGKLRPSS